MNTRVMVFGTFDLLHPGHLFFLREAASRGDMTVVVARESNVRRIKGEAPLQPDTVRIEAIQQAFPNAQVLAGDPQDFLAPIRAIKPSLILLGYDQKWPPGIKESDLGAIQIERLEAHEPSRFKTSIIKKEIAKKKKKM